MGKKDELTERKLKLIEELDKNIQGFYEYFGPKPNESYGWAVSIKLLEEAKELLEKSLNKRRFF